MFIVFLQLVTFGRIETVVVVADVELVVLGVVEIDVEL